MKITKVERSDTRPRDSYEVFTVTFTPNWFERLFGVKAKVEEYKTTGYVYTFGLGDVYVNKLGKEAGNLSDISDAIDTFRRSW